MIDFCWLPPLRLMDRGVDAGRFDSQLLHHAPGAGAVRRAARTKPAAAALAERAEGNVLADVQVGEQSEPLAVFGHQRDAGRLGFGRMAKRDLAALEKDFALRRLAAGAEQAFEQLGAAGSHQAGDAQNFAAAEREVDVLQAASARAWPGQGSDKCSTRRTSAPARARLREIGLLDLAADHQMRDPPGVGPLAARGCRPSVRRAAR